MTTYKFLPIKGINIFYRQSLAADKPNLLLLNGFPSSSHMYRDLIPLLAGHCNIIAPDYPGFGQSEAPDRRQFSYTFENISDVVESFTDALGLQTYYMYVFDYGAPIGFRLAMRHPEKILGIISQNGNVYEEGLGPKWAERKKFWENPTAQARNQYRSAFAPETIKSQYLFGTKKNMVGPDGYSLDIAYTRAPGYDEAQLDLIYDYRSNVALYPKFQAYLRTHRPPLLAAWGKNDPSFIFNGALAFLRDVPEAEIHLLDSGHFALETHAREISRLIISFIERQASQGASASPGR
jgi:pimeloyl-ACP methyl ester carboxylesterase